MRQINARKMVFIALLKIVLMSMMLSIISGEIKCTMPDDEKWLESDGKVIVRYAFDDSLARDNVLKNLILQAAEGFKEQTCVEWTETTIDDPCHKVVLARGDKCMTIMDSEEQKGVILTLQHNCYQVGTLLHEMMHSLGITHTNQRPDRDEYIRVWKWNIGKGYESNFDILETAKTYGVPYDYQSIMHYGRLFFSKNHLYTLTSSDSLALFSMGDRPERLRWSDTAMVNHHLNCVARLPTCTSILYSVTCKNNGYLLYNCTCSCPENTMGEFCETLLDRTLYDNKVQCGGLVETDTTIATNNFETQRGPGHPCVFQMVAKKCHQVNVKFIEVHMPGSKCTENVLAFEVQGFMRTYCKRSSVTLGRTLSFRKRRVAIHYRLEKKFPGERAGFQAEVTFQKNTTWLRGIELSDGMSDCYLAFSDNYYEFRTPYFPSTVSCFAECSEYFNLDMNGNDEGFMRLELTQTLKPNEKLTIQDRGFLRHIDSSSTKSLTMMVQMPVSVIFNGRDDPGEGFAMKMFQGYVPNCDGEIISVDSKGLPITNPIVNNETLSNCYMYFEASSGDELLFDLKGIEGDTLFIAKKPQRIEDHYQFTSYRESNPNFLLNDKSAILYYEPTGERQNWKIFVKIP